MESGNLLFEVVWVDGHGRDIGRDQMRAYDLSQALRKACKWLQRGYGHSDNYSRGFYVRSMREV